MANPVYTWMPNLVGYGRIVFMILAFYLCFTQPLAAAIAYSVSQLLDAVDGQVARLYGQCSKFGALLDMLTDRMSTAVLLVVLALQYPNGWGIFAFLIVLDVVSHWFQMYSKLAQKAATHKGSKNAWLNFYYVEVMHFWPRLPYLLLFCVGNEAFLIALYLLSFGEKTTGLGAAFHHAATILAVISFPIFVIKQLFNVIQLADAAGEVAQADWEAHKQQHKGVKQ